jgi:hypothetical protein
MLGKHIPVPLSEAVFLGITLLFISIACCLGSWLTVL